MSRQLVRLGATFFFTGHFPVAPATFASLVTLIVWVLLPPLPPGVTILVLAIVIAIGIPLAGRAESLFGHDGKPIVIDEVAGALLTVAFLGHGWKLAGIGFLVFRILDVVKPPPAYQLQSLPRGWGVMADDIMAGIYGNLLIRVLNLLWPQLLGGWRVKLEILTVGGEILSGRRLDTNFHFLARALARLGVSPLWHTTVPDQRDLLSGALKAALGRADGIIMTGGLGGTPDDITRRVVAQLLGRRLILREDVRQEVARIYRLRGRTPPPSAEGIALIPQGAEIFLNPVGLAPGWVLPTQRGGWLCALPGVPEEMRALVERFVLPYVERRLGGAGGWEIILRTAGVPETVLADRIGVEHPEGLEVAYLPNWCGVDLRLVRRLEARVTREQYEAWVARVREALGDSLYAVGEAPLEQRVGELAGPAGVKIAAAESVTGGGVGAALTRVPGSSSYFLGSVTAYGNEAKVRVLGVSRGLLLNHGAVSGPVAEAMAAGARHAFGADLAVATTGIAGPSGATPEKPVGLVYLGISSTRGETHVRRLFPGRSREAVTGRSVAAALWVLYRHLAGLPADDSAFWGARS